MNRIKIRKLLIYIVPILVLLLCIALMTSATILKKPFGEEDRLLEAIQEIEANTNKEEWKKANENIVYAEKAWHKVVNRVQYSVEREYMYKISETLARMKGGIKMEDDKTVIGEIYVFYDLWENLGK